MQRRTRRRLTKLAVAVALIANVLAAVAFTGQGLAFGGTISAAGSEITPASSPSPTSKPTPTSTSVPTATTSIPTATSTPSAPAEPEMDGYVTRTYTDPSGATMTYYLHIPSGYLPSQTYPLVLLLHGTGESALSHDTATQNAAMLLGNPYVKVWSGSSVQSRWPSFILVPQVIAPARWANATHGVASYTIQTQPELALQMTMAILQIVQTQYSVDPQRVYLTGISMGGYGAWEAAERWPSVFAAVVPVSGAGDPSKAARLVDVPVWTFQSKWDEVVPVAGSLDMINAIKSAGGQPCFTEFSGSSHDITTWMAVYDDNAMLQWLFAQGTPGASAPGLPHCSV